MPWDGLFLTKIDNGALAGAFFGAKIRTPPRLNSGVQKMGPKSLDWKGDPPKKQKKVVFGSVQKIDGFPVPKMMSFSCSGTTKYVIRYAYNTLFRDREKVEKTLSRGGQK